MDELKDTYKTIKAPSPEVIFKDRGSKFFGYAFPVKDETQIKTCIDRLKKEHYNARHWCYAWQLGERYDTYRVNDDGEPTNSAGAPIYGQIQSYELTNVLVVVVRYFGGTKLGVGGLIQAYKAASQMALEASALTKRTINIDFQLRFEYPEMNKVMRIIKEEGVKVMDQKLELDCNLIISVRKKEADRIFQIFDNTYKVAIKNLND